MKGWDRGRYFSAHGMVWRVVAIVLAATQVVACGSVLDALPGAAKSGSKSSNLAPTQSIGILSGVAKDSLIRNAVVNVYAWNGAKGELLGSGMTDSRGRYSLQLQVRSQSVFLEVMDGDYEEEVTGKTIPLSADQALYALQNYTSGRPLTTAITYYTTLATGLAENLVRLGMRPPDAVEEANARLRRIIGFDTRSVRPVDILDPDSVSVPELEYGFATAALSSLTERASILNDSEPHRIFTSVRFIQAAYDDVRADGVLNGRGSNGDVVFGRIRLTSQIYRHELALHILRIANNKTANRTGRGPIEMFDLARRLNDSTDPIFGGDPVIPIDSDKPNVSALVAEEFPNLPNDTVVFGGLNLSAMVVAFPGAGRAELILDDRVVGTAVNPENPAVLLDTFSSGVAEGRHALKLRVTDISGAVGESPLLSVNVSNQQTAIENITIAGQFVGMRTMVTANIVDPAMPRKIQYSVRPEGATAFAPIATIIANGDEVMLQPSVIIDPVQANFADGDATFKVEVTNSVGSVFSREVVFIIDKERPTVTLAAASDGTVPSGRYFDEDSGEPCKPIQPVTAANSCLFYAQMPFDIGIQATDNAAIDRVTLVFDGNDVEQPLVPTQIVTSSSSTFTIDPRSLRSPMSGAEKVATATAEDKARNTAIASQRIVFDTTPPEAFNFRITAVTDNDGSFVPLGSPIVVKGPVNIAADVEDEFGVASAQLLLNGTAVSQPILSRGTFVAIPPVQVDTSMSAPNGVNVVSVLAMDRAGNQMVSTNTLSFEVDNAPPVVSLVGLSFDRESQRFQLEGNVSDARFDSLVFTTDRGFQAPIPLDEAGAFVIGLSRESGTFTLEAKDTLGNIGTRNFSMRVAQTSAVTTMCELQENGATLFRLEVITFQGRIGGL